MYGQLKPLLLVVDDVKTNIHILVEILRDDYKVSVAINGESALEHALTNPPDLILLDIMMPGIDGYEVCKRLKNNESTKNIPIIFLTALTEEQNEARGLQLGAVDYITKPFSPQIVKARIKNHLELKRYRDHLEDLIRERTMDLILTQDATIYALSTLAEYRNPETGGHIKRTQYYVRTLSEQLKYHIKYIAFLDDKTIDQLFKSAPLHDIGKVGVLDSILLKAGKLTEEEFEEMKKHSTYGRDTIVRVEMELGNEVSQSFLRFARETAYYHHEKWDGSGYPQGIKGDDIPISGRLMAIADVYDALISKRVYKHPFSHEKAVTVITEGKGSHFDPDMVDAFLVVEEAFRQIALKFADFEEERQLLSKE